jgi:integrase
VDPKLEIEWIPSVKSGGSRPRKLGGSGQRKFCKQKVLTNEEAKIFLREAKITQHRFYEVWALALFTGMRSGELFELRWTDVDLEARIISVKRQWTSKAGVGPSKTKNTRQVPISDDLLLFLKEQKLKSQSDHVLPRLDEWENGEQAQVTRHFCEMLGITSVKFHDLQATFITNLLARGESLARVMAIVGHTQIKTTNVYLRLAGVDVKGGTDKLGYQIPADQTASVLQLVK